MDESVGIESYRSAIAGRPAVDAAELEPEPGLDVADIPGLDTIHRIGPAILDLRTTEGRELRITAKQDLRTGEYRAEYERRTIVKNTDGAACHVWTPTAIYGPMVSADRRRACGEPSRT